MIPPSSPPSSPPRPDVRPRAPSRRPLVVGLVVSAVLHLAVLAIYPRLAPRPGGIAAPSVAGPGAARPQGTEIVRLVEIAPEPEPEEPERPEPERPEPVPPRAAPAPVVPTPGDAAPPGAGVPTDEELMSAAERLRPRVRDPRLWAPLPENLLELSDEQRMKLDLALRLAAVADSMEAAAEAARRATDWTFTDSEGKKWGVSPGKIHLGDLTLPMPFGFSAPFDPSANDAWQWQDLERAAGATEAWETVKDRGQAIRERRDRERERTRPGPVRPDTLRLRR